MIDWTLFLFKLARAFVITPYSSTSSILSVLVASFSISFFWLFSQKSGSPSLLSRVYHISSSWRFWVYSLILCACAGGIAFLHRAFAQHLQLADLKESLRASYNMKTIETSFAQVEQKLRQEAEFLEKQYGDHPENVIPQLEFDDVIKVMNSEDGGRSRKEVVVPILSEIRKRGVVIVRNVIPRQIVKQWENETSQYIENNANKVRGYPVWGNPQILEMYYSKPQVAARQHPHMLSTIEFLNRFWKWSSDTSSFSILQKLQAENQPIESKSEKEEQIFFDPKPIIYLDRLRRREPGDASLSLGPHIDNGSIERWMFNSSRLVYKKILRGEYESYDAWDAQHRVTSKEIPLPNTATFFRTFQGWLAITEQGRGDGTLQVVPLLRESTAYLMLRPLQPDLSPYDFAGASFSASVTISSRYHPLLDKLLVSLPRIYPGDAVFWHPDVIHAVERVHQGQDKAIVFYIPSAPLCLKNAAYLIKQREAFRVGATPPDYPPLDLERDDDHDKPGFVGRATVSELSEAGRRAMGFDPYPSSNSDTPHMLNFVQQCNDILFHADESMNISIRKKD